MDKITNEIKETIKQAIDPDKIILFGSYAYGKPNENSDIDICIIKDVEKKQFRDIKLTLLNKLRKIIISNKIDIDIMVNNQKKIEERIKMGDLFYKDILEKGRIIYAK